MKIERRKFLMGAAAMPAVSFAGGSEVKPSGVRRLRLGVISDIHITDAASTAPFEAVLRIFDRSKVDGVIACGDLTDYGTMPQLELLANTWFKVFPNGRRSDGEPVANLMHYGDHDTSGNTYRRCKPCVKLYPDEEAMRKMLLSRNRKTAWSAVSASRGRR
jgi:hypothetical protein